MGFPGVGGQWGERRPASFACTVTADPMHPIQGLTLPLPRRPRCGHFGVSKGPFPATAGPVHTCGAMVPKIAKVVGHGAPGYPFRRIPHGARMRPKAFGMFRSSRDPHQKSGKTPFPWSTHSAHATQRPLQRGLLCSRPVPLHPGCGLRHTFVRKPESHAHSHQGKTWAVLEP